MMMLSLFLKTRECTMRNVQTVLDRNAGNLSSCLHHLAQCYIAARRRTGEAILEAAHYLSEARQVAQHGEWHLFLQTTGTSEDTAERLLHIHHLAMQNAQFADAVRCDWLSETVAALLARPSTPPSVIEEVLSASHPPSTRQVARAIQGTKRAKLRSAAESGSTPVPAEGTNCARKRRALNKAAAPGTQADALVTRLSSLLTANDRSGAVLTTMEILALLVHPDCIILPPYRIDRREALLADIRTVLDNPQLPHLAQLLQFISVMLDTWEHASPPRS